MIEKIWRPRRDLNPCYRRERAKRAFLLPFAQLQFTSITHRKNSTSGALMYCCALLLFVLIV
jgi:hypothetical protein